jgi:hypothetical protein
MFFSNFPKKGFNSQALAQAAEMAGSPQGKQNLIFHITCCFW